MEIFKDTLKLIMPKHKDYKEATFEYKSNSPTSKKERLKGFANAKLNKIEEEPDSGFRLQMKKIEKDNLLTEMVQEKPNRSYEIDKSIAREVAL